MNTFSITTLQHQFASWCAARAVAVPFASIKNKVVLAAIEAAGLQRYVGDPELLPNPESMDSWHHDKCERVQHELAAYGSPRAYGVAAKIVNVYFKAIYCHPATCDHARVVALHPPIDQEVIVGMPQFGSGNDALWRAVRWTNLTAAEYHSLIMDVRARANGLPLWHVEQLWRGRTA